MASFPEWKAQHPQPPDGDDPIRLLSPDQVLMTQQLALARSIRFWLRLVVVALICIIYLLSLRV